MDTTPKTMQFDLNQIAAIILREKKIHEGFWVVDVGFKFGAMNIGQNPSGLDAAPSAVASVTGIGLSRVDEKLPFSVDAAEVNPKV